MFAKDPGIDVKLIARLLRFQAKVEVFRKLLVFEPRSFHLPKHPDRRQDATETAPVNRRNDVLRPLHHPIEGFPVEDVDERPVRLPALEIDARDEVFLLIGKARDGVGRQNHIGITPEDRGIIGSVGIDDSINDAVSGGLPTFSVRRSIPNPKVSMSGSVHDCDSEGNVGLWLRRSISGNCQYQLHGRSSEK